MLGHNPFFFDILKKLTVSFGSIFNDVTIRRFNADGTEHERIGVPLAYGPKDKFLVKLAKGPKGDAKAAITLPRMSFLMTGYQRDALRQGNPIHKNIKMQDGSIHKIQYKPVAWNVDFELGVMTKNHSDGNQIIEQILPFFVPAWNVTINTVPQLGLTDDVPFLLNSINYDQVYEGEYKERRALIWNLTFTAKAFFYKPIQSSAIIRKVQVDYHLPPTDLDGDGNYEVTGEEMAMTPRSIRQTVLPDPIDAEPEDDYGYSEDLEDFDDMKKFNPVTGQDEEI